MRYTRLYADLDGETHFEDVEEATQPVEIAATGVFGVTPRKQANRVFLAELPPGYADDFHPPPVRYLVSVLKGVIETTASDGDVHRFASGSVVLFDDGGSKGHKSVVTSESSAEVMFVELAE